MNSFEQPEKADEQLNELVRIAVEVANPSAEANDDASIALAELPPELQKSLEAHGLGRSFNIIRTGAERHKQILEVLLEVIRTGQLKGWVGKVSEGQLYTAAPFILISKPGQSLIASSTGKVNGIALINGEYELLTPTLKKMFPHIPFVTCKELTPTLLNNL